MATSYLQDLPIELFGIILEDLSLVDCCSLRLTSSILAAKVVQTSFRTNFKSKSVKLNDTSRLATFASATKSSWLASALSELTLVGVVEVQSAVTDYNSWCEATFRSPTMADASSAPTSGPIPAAATEPHSVVSEETIKIRQQRAQHLVIACKNLREHLPGGRLYTLIIKVDRHFEWQPIWQCAIDTVRAVADAVESSNLKIERLDVYGSTIRCALGISELGTVARLVDADITTGLGLTLSEDVSGMASERALSLPSLLAPLKQIKELEIRWFNIHSAFRTDEQRAKMDFLNDLIALPPFPCLEDLAFRGLRTTEDTLFTFIDKYAHLNVVIIEQTNLTNGVWRPIFEHIDRVTMPKQLHLNDLREEGRLIQFPDETGEPHFSHPGGPTWMKYMPEDCSRPIVYKPMSGHIIGQPALASWQNFRQLMYGPPAMPVPPGIFVWSGPSRSVADHQ